MCGMSNGSCNGGQAVSIESWLDLQSMTPKNPLEVLLYAKLGTTEGIPGSTLYFNQPASGVWRDPLVSISGKPSCYAAGTDSQQKVEEAKYWTFSHLTWHGDINAPKALRKLVFLRGGPEWKMKIPLTFTSEWTDVMLSLRNNAATRGDAQGTVPVISFAGAFSGAVELEIAIKTFGQLSMALVGTQSGDTAMFEMEWIVAL
jgi:hypothetical protein